MKRIASIFALISLIIILIQDIIANEYSLGIYFSVILAYVLLERNFNKLFDALENKMKLDDLKELIKEFKTSVNAGFSIDVYVKGAEYPVIVYNCPFPTDFDKKLDREFSTPVEKYYTTICILRIAKSGSLKDIKGVQHLVYTNEVADISLIDGKLFLTIQQFDFINKSSSLKLIAEIKNITNKRMDERVYRMNRKNKEYKDAGWDT